MIKHKTCRWRVSALLVSTALLLSSTACSSSQSSTRFAELLEDDEIVAELRYNTTVTPDSTGTEPMQVVSLNVEQFVSEFTKSEGGWPSWLSAGNATTDSVARTLEKDASLTLDWLRSYVPSEAQANDSEYIWSLYWTLAMPPARVQLQILETELGADDLSEQDFDDFRSRYPEYLAELARAWLDVNSEHRPEWLRIE